MIPRAQLGSGLMKKGDQPEADPKREVWFCGLMLLRVWARVFLPPLLLFSRCLAQRSARARLTRAVARGWRGRVSSGRFSAEPHRRHLTSRVGRGHVRRLASRPLSQRPAAPAVALLAPILYMP